MTFSTCSFQRTIICLLLLTLYWNSSWYLRSQNLVEASLCPYFYWFIFLTLLRFILLLLGSSSTGYTFSLLLLRLAFLFVVVLFVLFFCQLLTFENQSSQAFQLWVFFFFIHFTNFLWVFLPTAMLSITTHMPRQFS